MSMIQMKENQLKLPLYPEWEQENKWKTGEIDTLELISSEEAYTSFTMNHLPNTITFTVLGKDMVVIDKEGVSWNKNGVMVRVEESKDLAQAFHNFFNTHKKTLWSNQNQN